MIFSIGDRSPIWFNPWHEGYLAIQIRESAFGAGGFVMAAKSKQRPEVMDQICADLRRGIPFKMACKSAGISETSGHTWRRDGWAAIEAAEEDSDAPVPFVAMFALEVEQAIRDYVAPLIERMRKEADGGGKGDWRAVHAILAARLPDDFSEKVKVAQNQRVEVAGRVEHAHGYAAQVRLMTDEELRGEIERLEGQIYAGLSGENLNKMIQKMERRLIAMKEAAANGTHYNWNSEHFDAGMWGVRPVSDGWNYTSKRPPKVVDLESYEVAGHVPSSDVSDGEEIAFVSAPSLPPSELNPGERAEWEL